MRDFYLLNIDELEKEGFQLCEFHDDYCDFCNCVYYDLFFKKINQETGEGDYYCRYCASKDILYNLDRFL